MKASMDKRQRRLHAFPLKLESKLEVQKRKKLQQSVAAVTVRVVCQSQAKSKSSVVRLCCHTLFYFGI